MIQFKNWQVFNKKMIKIEEIRFINAKYDIMLHFPRVPAEHSSIPSRHSSVCLCFAVVEGSTATAFISSSELLSHPYQQAGITIPANWKD